MVGDTAYLLAKQVSSSLDLDDVLDSIVRILKQVLNCRGSVIFLFDRNHEWLEMRASCGVKPQWQRNARMRIGEGISGRVAQDARPIYIPDARLEPGFIVFDPAVRSLFVVPLIHKGEVIGTLNVDDDKADAFSGDVGRLLTIAGAQAAAAIANAQLYHDLQERAEKLAQAHCELEESDRLKSEFVQNTSHELRTPLTFIKAYVELLLEGALGRLTDQQQISLRVVAQWTNRLVKLVDNTLAIQAIERGELSFAPVDLTAVARSAVESARVIARQSGLTLIEDWADVPPVWGDRARLEQVLINLIGNACKFSPNGGTITVRIRHADLAEADPSSGTLENGPRSQVRVQVIDEGIGIAPDQLTKIFERFYQVDGSSTRRFGGTGLGLAIVQETIQAHGGTIAVDSQVGVGSRFTFTLPGISPATVADSFETASMSHLSESNSSGDKGSPTDETSSPDKTLCSTAPSEGARYRRREMSKIKSYQDLLATAQARGPRTVVAVGAAQESVLDALAEAEAHQIATHAILIGDENEIQQTADECHVDISRMRVIHQPVMELAAERAMIEVNEGRAHIAMKGDIVTATFLRAALDRETGLRTGRLLSHVAVFEMPSLGRPLLISDGGVNIAPNLAQKADIIRNAIDVARKLGTEMPRVAVLASTETVIPTIPANVEAAALAKMADRGQITGAIVDGPLALDNAISPESVQDKEITSQVAGRADILILPDIEAANVLVKAIIYFAQHPMAGCVVGARVPLIVPSRSDTAESKLGSLALGVIMST